MQRAAVFDEIYANYLAEVAALDLGRVAARLGLDPGTAMPSWSPSTGALSGFPALGWPISRASVRAMR
jgi:hypothetical protein